MTTVPESTVPENTGPETVTRVGVVGCGAMGSGIAEVCARAGLDVVVSVPDGHSVESGRGMVMASLDRAVARGRTTPRERAALLERLTFRKTLADLIDRELVIEAIREDAEDKISVFRRLSGIVPERAVLASTTSSIPVSRLARASRRPGRVVGMHFFNPVPAMPLVELARSPQTDDDAYEAAEKLIVGSLGKEVVHSSDRAGFIVNALLIPYLLNAIRLVDSGVASAETIDRAMVLGCAHPVGPLKLADMIGLDVIGAVAENLSAELDDDLYAPPNRLRRMTGQGHFGRKSGRGFYEYPAQH